MRTIGTSAYGVRLPIISPGDPLPEIIADSLLNVLAERNIKLNETDVLGITEAIVAKYQDNFASLSDISADVRAKFGGEPVGVLFPILSRNRFLNILKGIAKSAKKVYVMLNYPGDEVGNPIMDAELIDELTDSVKNLTVPVPAAKFRDLTNNYKHPFTGIDYTALYETAGDNVEVFVSNDPRDILKLTNNVIVAEIHSRFRTLARLKKAGVAKACTLSDILNRPISGGYNEKYGVLGSNLSTDDKIKLFPRDCDDFITQVRDKILAKTGTRPEVLVYGDGAFKDPSCGIWELADPVVSPAFTERLAGQPNEIKLKFVADNLFDHLDPDEKTKAVADMIKDKSDSNTTYAEGTTPRQYSDLLGTLCDLMSGSGDKGTPVVLIQGYFDNYASE